MSVGFGVHQTGVAVAGTAANAGTLPPILFVKHHTEGRVKWLQAETREIIAQLLDTRLVTDCRIRKCTAAVRLGGIFANFAVHMINAFSLDVVRLELTV